MRTFLLTLALSTLLCTRGRAQNRPTGLLTDTSRYAAVPLLPEYHPGEKADEVRISVDLTPYCPVAGNQEGEASCVGWAVGYGAMTINRAIQLGTRDRAGITQLAHSAAFVYNLIKTDGDCSAGAYIEDALILVEAQGNCFEKEYNFSLAGCATPPAPDLMLHALPHRIAGYAAVFTPEDDARTKFARVCEVVNANRPVVVGLRTDRAFWDIRPGTRVWRPGPVVATDGKHAMVVVGYDQVEKQFTLLNSFGPAWGNNGFIRVGFADFARLCEYAYVLLPGKGGADAGAVDVDKSSARASGEAAEFGGEFVFRRPAGYLTDGEGERTPFFQEVNTVRANERGLYVPKVSLFSVGDVFQLVARNVPGGAHVYVFSQGSDGTVKLHFPRSTDRGLSADFMLSEQLELVIPTEASVLQLGQVGDDYLCVIYSTAPIRDMADRLRKLDGSGAQLPARARSAFFDVLLPADAVAFDATKMAFRARPAAGKTAAGLFLKVTTE